MGGLNSRENIVKLTPREHYVCHWLLTKMTTTINRAKMICALWFMSNLLREKISSQRYEAVKTALQTNDVINERRSKTTTLLWENADFRSTMLKINQKPDVKEKRSKSNKEAQCRPEVKAKHRRRLDDPNFRKRHSLVTKQAMNRDDVKKKIEIAKNDPEKKEKRSKSNKEAQRRPEVNSRRKASLKKYNDKFTFEERCTMSRTNKPVVQLTYDGKIIATFQSAAEATRKTGVKKVKDCARGIRAKAGGFLWKYL